MALRKLVFLNKSKIEKFCRNLLKTGKRQHWERIKSKCLVLQNNFETLADTEIERDEFPPLYSTWISGTVLNGMQPFHGYRIYFTANEQTVFIIEIQESLIEYTSGC